MKARLLAALLLAVPTVYMVAIGATPDQVGFVVALGTLVLFPEQPATIRT